MLAIESKKPAQKENKKFREIAWDRAKPLLESFPEVQKLKATPLTHKISVIYMVSAFHLTELLLQMF